MAVTQKSRSIQMTANADAFAQPVCIKEIWFGGTGLTAGQRLTIVEESSGSVVVDFFVPATDGSWECRINCGWQKGLLITAFPASGGTVTVITE